MNRRTGPSYFGFNSFDGCYIDPLDAQGIVATIQHSLIAYYHYSATSDEEQRKPLMQLFSSPIAAAFNNSEDEDYSVSMSAVMQRRASQRGSRKKSHRTSSPMGHVSGNTIGVAKGGDRRRSSVYTTSSGE